MATVRQQIKIDAPSRAVWAALTTAEGIAAWWSTVERVDGREGGRIVLTREVDGESIEERGLFHEFRPTRKIEIAWDGGPQARVRGSRLQFLVGRDEGETRLHVVASGGLIDQEEGLSETLDAEWHDLLLRLRAYLEA